MFKSLSSAFITAVLMERRWEWNVNYPCARLPRVDSGRTKGEDFKSCATLFSKLPMRCLAQANGPLLSHRFYVSVDSLLIRQRSYANQMFCHVEWKKTSLNLPMLTFCQKYALSGVIKTVKTSIYVKFGLFFLVLVSGDWVCVVERDGWGMNQCPSCALVAAAVLECRCIGP